MDRHIQPDSVCIVVINWNSAIDTTQCLQSLERVTGVAWSGIVLDNGSTDASPQSIKQWLGQRNISYREVRICNEECMSNISEDWSRPRASVSGGAPFWLFLKSKENLGFAGGCNVCIKAALRGDFDYVLLVNNDAQLGSGALDELIRVAKKSQNAIVGSTIENESGTQVLFRGAEWPHMLFRFPASFSNDDPQGWIESAYADGACMLLGCDFLRKRIASCRSVFDVAYFMYCEEVDLCLYARASGDGCVVSKHARARHFVAKSSGGYGNPRTYYYLTRNRIRLANRWLSFWLKIVFHAYYVPSRILIVLRHSANGRHQQTLAILEGLFDGYFSRFGKWRRH